MVPTEVLTPEAILEATEGVLRRHGPAKATVLDVARVLGVSHGSVYRHFGSKAALRGAVLQRWLQRAHVVLPGIAESDEEPVARLRAWLRALFDAKRAKALDDPELFATYEVLVSEQADVVADHLDELVGQLQRIVADGVAAGTVAAPDVRRAARAVFHATSRFHDPAHAAAWAAPGADDDFEALVTLVLDGLVVRA